MESKDVEAALDEITTASKALAIIEVLLEDHIDNVEMSADHYVQTIDRFAKALFENLERRRRHVVDIGRAYEQKRRF